MQWQHNSELSNQTKTFFTLLENISLGVLISSHDHRHSETSSCTLCFPYHVNCKYPRVLQLSPVSCEYPRKIGRVMRIKLRGDVTCWSALSRLSAAAAAEPRAERGAGSSARGERGVRGAQHCQHSADTTHIQPARGSSRASGGRKGATIVIRSF